MSIKLQNISLSYSADRVLLDDVSVEFPTSSLTALLGRNGTGKSTLLRAVCGVAPACGGRVVIDNTLIDSESQRQSATLVSLVTTEKIRISNLTCQELVALGRAPYTNWVGRLSEHDKEIVAQSLAKVGMSSFATKCLDRMSDGECQRVMIARALAQDTSAILLDEPTAFLDLPNRREVCELLREIAHNDHKTIVFSTHDLDIALELCDNIALIDTPNLLVLPPDRCVDEGHIQRLFNIDRRKSAL